MEQRPRLFHISEQAGIALFEPRPAPRRDAYPNDLMVWAVDESHLANYLLPRDCPRVTFAAGMQSNPADVVSLMGPGQPARVIAVESCWLSRIHEQRLIRYEFDPQPFQLQDGIAGYWVTRLPVRPIAESLIANVLEELLRHSVEMRIMPSLWKLREAVIRSTLEFSIIRMRNAQPPAEGLAAYYPLP